MATGRSGLVVLLRLERLFDGVFCRAVKNLNAKARLALFALAAAMGLLLFVPAGTVHFWQAWAYVSIFTGASALITLYLMRRDSPATADRGSRRGISGESGRLFVACGRRDSGAPEE